MGVFLKTIIFDAYIYLKTIKYDVNNHLKTEERYV